MVAYQAAKLAENERQKLLDNGMSFCMETVLSDRNRHKLDFLKEAQSKGNTVVLVFIGLANPELSKARVWQRVLEGGHDVPDDRLDARFPRTLRNFEAALGFVDLALVFDDSFADYPYRFIALFRRRKPAYLAA